MPHSRSRVCPTLVACLVSLACSTALAQDRPNILWISVEDISANLGCYGDDYAVTPNLDRLAKQGIRYTRCFGHAGVCAVNRTGLITSMYPTTIGTMHMRCNGVPPHYVKCFPEYLRAAGYWCTNRSKTDYNFAPPFTAWDRQGNNHGDWAGRAEGQPFFSVINLTLTHESRIRQADRSFQNATKRLIPEQRHDPANAPVPPYYPDTPIVRKDIARYHDNITAMDYIVGDILAKLEQDGLADDTIVWFWSDHGWGMPRGKRWIYDSGMHVPMIVRFPKKWAHLAPGGKAVAGSTHEELVAFIDYGATVLSLAGIKPPAYMQGRPFMGRFQADPREYVFAARDRMDETYDIIRAVRDKRYKYIRNYEPWRSRGQHINYMDKMPTMIEMRRLHAEGKLKGPQLQYFEPTKPLEELYDTKNDPHEINNLAESAEHKGTLDRLRAAHEDWRTRTRDLGLIPEPILWERMRPGGVFAVTQSPTIRSVVAPLPDKTQVHLSSATPGASIGYRVNGGDWKLYSGPVLVDKGATLETKASRLGYRDSKAVKQKLE